MMVFKLDIPGTPIAKKRPRFARIGKFVRTYDVQETEESRFLHYVENQWKLAPIAGAISLTCVFVMPIPKSTSRKKADAMLSGATRHTKKPDCDNLIKFVKDCLNGVVWKDDSQVYRISAEKVYGENPGTHISIEEEMYVSHN